MLFNSYHAVLLMSILDIDVRYQDIDPRQLRQARPAFAPPASEICHEE
jgi:hypothetical protein